jgi:hypothetical protein
MAKNPFEDMDPDLKAMGGSLRPSAGPMRWGRILTGILIVGTATFAFAYHLPLQQAHEKLTNSFAALQSQVESGSRALKDAQAQAKEAAESKQELQSKLDELKQTDKAHAEQNRSVASALEAKLAKPLAKNQAAIGSADAQAVAALSLGYVLNAGKLDVSAPGKDALCSVAGASGKKAIRVLAIADKKSIPPGLAGKLKTPLDYSSAVAAVIAQALIDKCSVEPSAVSATGFAAEPSASSKIEGKKLAGARVELWLDTSK